MQYDKKRKEIHLFTVNVVIFAGGKFRKNVGKTFHVGVILPDTTPIPS